MSSSWMRAALYFALTEGVWVLVLTPFLLYFEFGSVDFRFAGPLLVSLGAALLMAGSALSLNAGYHLIEFGNGTPWPFRPPRRLVESGPYARIRNPQAAAMLAVTGGVAIALDSTQIWLMPGLAALYLFVAALPAERRQLEELHGASYKDYVATVPGWWPRGGLR